MSDGIKRMLREREERAEAERLQAAMLNSGTALREEEAAMKMIDLAQPFIDEHATDPTKFTPSAKLRIGYCLIGTSAHPERALDFVERNLDIARARYKAGLDPNPFLEARQ